MKSSLHSKGVILGAVSGLVAIGITFSAGKVFQRPAAVASSETGALAIPPPGLLAIQGRKLFMMNCAHCHGRDARGDEGPDLHGLAKSDARIASLIKDGKKGEMPKFGTKLTDTEVQALTAFIRTLKD